MKLDLLGELTHHIELPYLRLFYLLYRSHKACLNVPRNVYMSEFSLAQRPAKLKSEEDLPWAIHNHASFVFFYLLEWFPLDEV